MRKAIEFTLPEGVQLTTGAKSGWNVKITATQSQVQVNLHWHDKEWPTHTFIMSADEWREMNQDILRIILGETR